MGSACSSSMSRLAACGLRSQTRPRNPDIAGVSIVQIAESWQGVGAVSKNAVVVAPGRLDRSACGTGLSARMAALHARGSMKVGDTMAHASVIGTSSMTSVMPGPPPTVASVTIRPHRPVPGGLPAHRHVAGP
jgi:proline racemase